MLEALFGCLSLADTSLLTHMTAVEIIEVVSLII